MGHWSGCPAWRAAVAALMGAAVSVQCGGSPTAPTQPLSSNAAPVITSITVSRTHIEAGDEIDVFATVPDGDAPPDHLRYAWAANPAGGAFSGLGPRVKWRAPSDGPVPAAYTLTVTITEPHVGAGRGMGSTVALEHRVTGSSPAVRVNHALREMRRFGDTFMADFSDSSVSPLLCIRNFTNACAGRQRTLGDITDHRDTYTVESARYTFRQFERSVWAGPNCTAPDRSASCAVLLYAVEWIWRRKSDGVQEHVRGHYYLGGVYRLDQWWLCDGSFRSGQ